MSRGLALAWSSFPSSESLQPELWCIFSTWFWESGLLRVLHFHVLNCQWDIVLSSLFRISGHFQFWILNELTATLGHQQGCLGLKLGSKSWSKIDSKNFLDFCVWVSITLFKNARVDVFSLLHGIKLFLLLCLSCLNVWTPNNVNSHSVSW